MIIKHEKDTESSKICSYESAKQPNGPNVEYSVKCTKGGKVIVKSALPIYNKDGKIV